MSDEPLTPGVRRDGLKKLSASRTVPMEEPSLLSRATRLFSRLWPKRNATVENSVEMDGLRPGL